MKLVIFTLFCILFAQTRASIKTANVVIFESADFTKMNAQAKALGIVEFTQDGNNDVRITGKLQIPPGYHGWHIHDLGDFSTGCAAAKSHFNPHNYDHASPMSTERHVGDLGNILSNSEGVADIDVFDKVIRLNGPHSIIGRMLVIHADQDDMGLGGDDESRKTGNAGARIGCGIIGTTTSGNKPAGVHHLISPPN